jgi:hypothetical protein
MPMTAQSIERGQDPGSRAQKMDTSPRMRIATDTLGKAKTRKSEVERHKQRDEQRYDMSP